LEKRRRPITQFFDIISYSSRRPAVLQCV
jgi:hypothetical protein